MMIKHNINDGLGNAIIITEANMDISEALTMQFRGM
jgi:hypothetical protein